MGRESTYWKDLFLRENVLALYFNCKVMKLTSGLPKTFLCPAPEIERTF